MVHPQPFPARIALRPALWLWLTFSLVAFGTPIPKAALVKVVPTYAGVPTTPGVGFFISKSGELLTNYHVVAEALTREGYGLLFQLSDGRQVRNFKVGRCGDGQNLDACILKIDTHPAHWQALESWSGAKPELIRLAKPPVTYVDPAIFRRAHLENEVNLARKKKSAIADPVWLHLKRGTDLTSMSKLGMYLPLNTPEAAYEGFLVGHWRCTSGPGNQVCLDASVGNAAPRAVFGIKVEPWKGPTGLVQYHQKLRYRGRVIPTELVKNWQGDRTWSEVQKKLSPAQMKSLFSDQTVRCGTKKNGVLAGFSYCSLASRNQTLPAAEALSMDFQKGKTFVSIYIWVSDPKTHFYYDEVWKTFLGSLRKVPVRVLSSRQG